MNKFLYTFGYCTPSEQRARQHYGIEYDTQEDSEAVFIVASTKEEAQRWGDAIAGKFIQILYGDNSMQLETAGGGRIENDGPFVHWNEEDIKKHPEEHALAVEKVNKIPVVKVGEYPDIQKLVHERYGPADLSPAITNSK